MTYPRSGRTLPAALLCCVLGACGAPGAKTTVAPTPARPVSGEYVVTAYSTVVGPIRFRMDAEPTETGFRANTPTGVAWLRVGGLQGLLGPVLAPFLFPRGMIVTWESALPEGETPGEGTIGVGTLDSMRIPTRMTSTDEPVELRLRDGRVIALLDLRRSEGDWTPPDYPALAAATREAMGELLYDPALARSAAVRRYLRDVDRAAELARDDVEFYFGLFFAARTHLRFTAPLLYPRDDDGASRAMFEGRPAQPLPYAITRDAESGVTTLRFEAFIGDEMVDRAFAEALSPTPRGLVIDLRSCVGIDLSHLRAASWVIGEPLDAGAFIGGASRATALGGAYADLPMIDFPPEGSSAAVQARLDAFGAARVRVLPRPNAYRGPVAVTSSGRTSSTGEALVAALGQARAATVVGERTSGKPLLAREKDLGQGWSLRVAGYDFLPPDGETITGRGHEPDVRTSRGAAPTEAIKLLRARAE